jgi:hypothetical protein
MKACQIGPGKYNAPEDTGNTGFAGYRQMTKAQLITHSLRCTTLFL